MGLPAPNLDDRRFQDLVDDARRLVQRRCPEWTDHNVSDPGITLIETFAYLVDQVLYRLNRVPERSYVTFLELMGVELFAPSAARAPVTFWLTAPMEEDRVIEAATEVATRRRRTSESIIFRTVDDLVITSCRRTYVMTGGADGRPYDQTSELANERPVAAFSSPPEVGDVLFIGLSRAVPNCAVAIHVDCDAEGHGIDPTDPPWVWEALGADGWVPCDVDDRTGGFNEPGDVIVHVPGSHVETVIEERSAGWLRCRIVAATGETQTPYTDSPLLRVVEADTVGGTANAVHGEDIVDEVVGVSEGVPGQRFVLLRRPVVPSERPVQVEVATEDGWVPWTQVQTFGDSSVDDQHWRLNANEGSIVFGPAVRMEDGSLRNYGSIPPAGAHIRVRRYRTGGGQGRQRRRPRDRHAPLGDPVHRLGRQPAPGRRRRRRGVRRGRQDAGTARARHPQPGRDGPRLRAAGPRGDARGRPRALPARRRGGPRRRRHGATRPASASSSCRRSRAPMGRG